MANNNHKVVNNKQDMANNKTNVVNNKQEVVKTYTRVDNLSKESREKLMASITQKVLKQTHNIHTRKHTSSSTEHTSDKQKRD